MKTLEEIKAELVVATEDLQAIIDTPAPTPEPVVDPVTEVDVITASGHATAFVPVDESTPEPVVGGEEAVG